MCGIAGFSTFKTNFNAKFEHNIDILRSMSTSISRRGPDENNIFLEENIGFAHARLSIIDLKSGKQPMKSNCEKYTIIYNGELYNTNELRLELTNLGYIFKTECDTEVILANYIINGVKSPEKLNGIFSFCIWDDTLKHLFMCRDRVGVKPLFYTINNDTLIFGSELKALLSYPNIKPVLDKDGICEIFGLFPSKTEGNGIFKGMHELKPGHYAIFNENGFSEKYYWQLNNIPSSMSYKETLKKTKFLVTDSIKRQMISDVPISTFLSGGIDSSIITGVISQQLKKQNKQLDTYSFDYEDNAKYFVSNSFQVDTDEKWVIKMIANFNTNHTFLKCNLDDLIKNLYTAVDAKDYPGMADIDSSLLYFCSKVKENHKVALSGECADEIFAGYPWFHDPDVFETNTFPWIRNSQLRTMLLSDNVLDNVNILEYVQKKYDETILQVPIFENDTLIEKRRREISFLNIKWFMTTLLDRTDRMSMYSGLEVRVPYADHRIIELLWNTPWDYKYNGTPKSLLRDAFKDLLPEELINRKKSPYPKTYNPLYEETLKKELLIVMEDETSPILKVLNKDKVLEFLKTPTNYGEPWFGQLMATPQLIAFYLQTNYWLKTYNVIIEI